VIVRSLLFAAAFYIWSTLCALSFLPLLLAPGRWMVAAWGVWARGIILLLRGLTDIRVEVRGRQHMPTGGALIAAKHQCMFDVFAQFAWLPCSSFVMKKELLWIPVFAWEAVKGGVIVVDRDGHSKALKKMVADAKQRFADKRQVVIFPEGTRTAPGTPGDYKPGIAALYRELDVPVHLMATNSGAHWPRHGFLRRPGTIVFEYLEPIQPGLKRGEFMRLLQERIDTASNQLLVG
jgi:1-acyl-sn-glycerol-3-phosphate acyltransferase